MTQPSVLPPILYAIPYLSLAAAIIIPYWPRAMIVGELAKLPGGFDNGDPRRSQQRLEGFGRRALNAHLNGLETLPMFGIGVLAAMQRSVDIRWVCALCLVFLITRIIHAIAYFRDRQVLRGLMFQAGLLSCLALCVLAAFAGAN